MPHGVVIKTMEFTYPTVDVFYMVMIEFSQAQKCTSFSSLIRVSQSCFKALRVMSHSLWQGRVAGFPSLFKNLQLSIKD